MLLMHAAYSANIKERHDCSTALFDPDGEMVMQAEHIPVHLGAMPAAVAAVLDGDHAPGRSWILNDPYRGGTHLPDITIVTPAFTGDGELLGFAASRAHHADVGGRVPGSMPADSRTLAEEGVVIGPRVLDPAAVDELVVQMRQPDQRRADLRAQLAAGRIGVRRLEELAAVATEASRQLLWRRFTWQLGLVGLCVGVQRLQQLGVGFPLPIEVIPMARSVIARRLVALGGNPVYRQGFVTDNGNVILDVYGLSITDALALESEINQWPGVVCNGIFARQAATTVLIAGEHGVEVRGA